MSSEGGPEARLLARLTRDRADYSFGIQTEAVRPFTGTAAGTISAGIVFSAHF